jgi:archaellum component FlaC
MMGIKQRDELIERIKNIQDPRVIEEIYRLLDVTIEEESVYIPTDEQKKAIAQAREEINRGEGVPFEEVDKEFDAWLNE